MTDKERKRLQHVMISIGAAEENLSEAYADLMDDLVVREYGDQDVDEEDRESIAQDPRLVTMRDTMTMLDREYEKIRSKLLDDDSSEPPF